MDFGDIAIWWTDENQARITDHGIDLGLPDYIINQMMSRLGRNGRGRLWVDSMFGDVAVGEWPGTLMAAYLTSYCAGIVILRTDIHLLCEIPGIITDFGLQRI